MKARYFLLLSLALLAMAAFARADRGDDDYYDESSNYGDEDSYGGNVDDYDCKDSRGNYCDCRDRDCKGRDCRDDHDEGEGRDDCRDSYGKWCDCSHKDCHGRDCDRDDEGEGREDCKDSYGKWCKCDHDDCHGRDCRHDDDEGEGREDCKDSYGKWCDCHHKDCHGRDCRDDDDEGEGRDDCKDSYGKWCDCYHKDCHGKDCRHDDDEGEGREDCKDNYGKYCDCYHKDCRGKDCKGENKYIPEREVYGIDGANRLVVFNSRDVSDIQRYEIKDCYDNEKIRGINFKGKDLYGVSENRVFQINYRKYKIEEAKELRGCRLEGTGFGVDFVPDSCYLRVISNTGKNYLIDVTNGYCQVQSPIQAYDDDCKEPKISGAAYYNAQKLYVIDYENDVLGEIKYPASRGIFKPVGSLCLDTSVVVGFDIFQEYNKYYAWAALAESNKSGFFSIDLKTGKAHLIDWIPGSRLSSLAVKCDY